MKRQLWNYSVAIALVLIALLLMLAVDPYIQVKNTTFLIFHTALTLAAWYGGRKAGILATVLSAFLATYFFVDPILSLSATFASGARLLIFVLQGILISVLVGALRRAQQQSKRSLKFQEAAFYEQQAVLRELQQAEEALRRSEEQQAFLLKLNDTLRPLMDVEEIQYQAVRILGEHLGASRVGYAEDQADGETIVVTRNYTNGVPGIEGRYRYDDYGAELLRELQAGRTVVRSDIAHDPTLTDAEKARHAALQLGATVDVPLLKTGRLVAVLFANYPVAHLWTEVEVSLIQEVVDRIWAAVERARAEAALRRSEERYRTLFESMDEGFCIIEMIFDADDRPIDYRFLITNPAFDRQTGTENAQGRTVREIAPDHEAYWFEIYGNIALTGEARRFENRAEEFHRWYDVHAFRIGEPDLRRVGILFNDITERKQSEEDRAEAEQRYRIVGDLIPFGIWEADLQGNATYLSPLFLEMTGTSLEEHRRVWPTLLHPDDTQPTVEAWYKCVRTGGMWEHEFRIRGTDGHYRTILARGLPVRNAAGEITSYVGANYDMTDRKRAEVALRDRENMLGGIVGSITDALIMIDKDWRYTFANEEFLHRVSMSLADVIGNNVWELFPAAIGNEAYIQLYRAMAERISVEYEVFYEPYQRWFSDKAYPTADGGLAIYSRDITDRKQAEIQLQISEERLQLAISSARLGMWFWDIEPDTLIWTERCKALFGLPLDDAAITYADFMAVLHPDDRQPTHEAVVRAIEERVDYDIEYRAVWQDGSVHWIAAKGSCVFDAAGKAVRMNGVVIDIDDRKQAEARLRQREAELREAQRIGKIGNWYWDAKTDVTTGSDELLRIYGFDPERDTMPNFADQDGWLYPHDSWQRINQGVQQALETGVGYELDVQAFCNSTPIWITTRSEVLHDSDGTITGLRGTVQDITARKQAEEELRRQKEENEQLLQILPVAVWVTHDRSCQTITGNPFAEQLLSLPEDANASVTQPVEARNWIRHLHNGREMTTEELPLQRTIASGSGVKDIEFSLERVDGRLIHLLGNTAPLFDAEGRIRGAVAVCLDVTQWKQAAAALAENEARLRGFVEANIVGVLYGDIYGNIFEANDELLRIVGYTREDLQAGRLRWIDITPPEYLPLDAERIAEARDQGACTPYEKEYIRKDGSRVPVLVGYSLVGSAREESVAFILDLTDRKQAEQERERLLQQEQILRQQAESAERRLYALLESIREDFVLLDRDWRVVYLNSQAAATMQKSRDEILGRCHWDLFPDLVGTEFYDRLHQAMHEQTSLQFEYHYEIWDTWFENRVYPADEGIIVLSSNITDRVQFERDRECILQQEQAAREAAENANRVKDEFLAVLSHELRSPLNPILGWSKLLQKGNLNPAKTKTALATIERNTQLQAQLIDDLLDIARILRGKLSLNEAAVDLGFVISSALETVRLAAEAKAIDLRFAILDFGLEDNPKSQIQNPKSQVLGDAGRLQQVMWNLLSNAVKFTPQGGQVTVALTQSDSSAQIQVTDTGKGIHPDFLPYVFEHFRQEDGATTRKFGGLGLGLAIARQIVELHGGTIAVESAGEGQGATFTVQLPLAPLTDQQPPPESASIEIEDLSGIRIWVVDDEIDSREFVAFVLEQAGANVASFSSGIEVLQAIEQTVPDLIVSDIGMPEMDGYMLLQQIRSSDRGRHIPAIALTAYAGEFDRQQALQAGFQQHIAKPVEPSHIVTTVTRLCGQKGDTAA